MRYLWFALLIAFPLYSMNKKEKFINGDDWEKNKAWFELMKRQRALDKKKKATPYATCSKKSALSKLFAKKNKNNNGQDKSKSLDTYPTL